KIEVKASTQAFPSLAALSPALYLRSRRIRKIQTPADSVGGNSRIFSETPGLLHIPAVGSWRLPTPILVLAPCNHSITCATVLRAANTRRPFSSSSARQ